MDLLVISGLSGGGKSTALRALEDLGFYCADNVPIPLVPQLVTLVGGREADRPIAVGIDAREAQYLEDWPNVHRELQARGHRVEVLFIEAVRDVLVRRYSETRRRHPMGELPEAIDLERTLLEPLRRLAERPVDSSTLTERQLRQLVRDRYASVGMLRITLTSFAFREGVPSEADWVFDSRFLDNPNDDPALRPLSGLHEPVSRYVLSQPDAGTLLEQIEALVRFAAPRVAKEGRSYLTVAVGCTGGQHRSVTIVEELKQRLTRGTPLVEPAPRIVLRHRDLGGGG